MTEPSRFDISQYACVGRKATGRRIVCGREWCPSCGEPGSIPHMQRAKHLLPYAFDMNQVGHLVLTVPPEIAKTLAIDDLVQIQRIFRKKWKRKFGETRALGRWHLFGDGSTRKHPHLNLLIDANRFSSENLEAIHKMWRKTLKNVLGVSCQSSVIRYQYYSLRRMGPDAYFAKLWDLIEYVTRPTFRKRNWAPDWAEQLSRRDLAFVWSQEWDCERGVRRWERWAGVDQDHDQSCPVCGARTTVVGIVPTDVALAGAKGITADGIILYDLPQPENDDTADNE